MPAIIICSVEKALKRLMLFSAWYLNLYSRPGLRYCTLYDVPLIDAMSLNSPAWPSSLYKWYDRIVSGESSWAPVSAPYRAFQVRSIVVLVVETNVRRPGLVGSMPVIAGT